MNKGDIVAEPLKHVDSPDCWCSPSLMTICLECEDSEDPDCWKCSGAGLVEHSGDPNIEPILKHNF